METTRGHDQEEDHEEEKGLWVAESHGQFLWQPDPRLFG
jgi:hypothetical protein